MTEKILKSFRELANLPAEAPPETMVMNGNKIFNINVVTEDGNSQHEDYPHQIDLIKYPQFSKLK